MCEDQLRPIVSFGFLVSTALGLALKNISSLKGGTKFVVEKVYFKSQILVHEYWTIILDHFCVLVS